MLDEFHCLLSARVRREYLRISADDVAKRLGIKRTSYLRMERGERGVALHQGLAIAQMLRCTCEQLTRLPTPDEVRELYALRDGGEAFMNAVQENVTVVDDSAQHGHATQHAPAPASTPTLEPTQDETLAAALAGWVDEE